jgi:hypothetical protein
MVPEEVRKSLGGPQGQTEMSAVLRATQQSRTMVAPESTALGPTRPWRIRTCGLVELKATLLDK